MITALILVGIEKLVNLALRSDTLTQSGLKPLTGKVLRLTMDMPAISIDVLFNDDHVRFEPVTSIKDSVFETQGFQHSKVDSDSDNNADSNFNSDFDSDYDKAWQQQSAAGHSIPDCTINVANPAELLNLLRAPQGNLPIEGDYKVLMQVKQLIAGFDPDIAGQLEPIIGVPMASQLSLLINHLKGNVAHSAKHTFNDVADWANDVAGNKAADPEMKAEVDDLKQQLLKLRADVEREETRLAMIKAEQAALKSQK